jgi:hypothetical protein
MKNCIILLSLLFISSCSQNDLPEEIKISEELPVLEESNIQPTRDSLISNINPARDLMIDSISENEYSTKTIFSLEHGWGYQILNNGKLYINQPHIPSIQGNNGFKTEDNANITATYIIHKLNNNVFPPTVSKEELDSLGVL